MEIQAERSSARSAVPVIERGPRPTATMPDCTISLIPYGSSTLSSSASIASSALSPPKAMQRGSPLSRWPRQQL